MASGRAGMHTRAQGHTQTYSRRKWFNALIGFREGDWDFAVDSLPPFVRDNMGEFKTISLKELERATRLPPPNEHAAPFEILTRGAFTHEQLFDTSSIQSGGPQNAIVQVASNFNCLEVSSTDDDPFDGKYLSFLMQDTTQGPSAAGGAVFGSFNILGIHFQHRISLLEDLGGLDIADKNGKLPESKVSISQVEALERMETFKNIKVGFLKRTRSVIDRNATLDSTIRYHPDGPFIDQVFTSTCIVRTRSRKALRLQEVLLRVSYESIYLLAIRQQSPLVVLTFVGGGVFGNDINTTIQIICKTHLKYSQYLAKGCTVSLPVYMPQDDEQIVEQFRTYMDVLHLHTSF